MKHVDPTKYAKSSHIYNLNNFDTKFRRTEWYAEYLWNEKMCHTVFVHVNVLKKIKEQLRK